MAAVCQRRLPAQIRFRGRAIRKKNLCAGQNPEQAEGLWQWLQEGAHIYVCGDAAKMAKDVEAALLDVIIGAGHLDEEGAEEYLDMLREEKRYQRDVY